MLVQTCVWNTLRRFLTHPAIFRQCRYYTFQTTSFRVTVPLSHDTDYEDIFLYEPSRDDMIKQRKDISLTQNFVYERNSLNQKTMKKSQSYSSDPTIVPVEKNIFLTKEELLQHMFYNGYSHEEIKRYEEKFPDTYRFHVPELAILFNIPDSEAYKYCLRIRAEDVNRDFVEVKKKPASTKVGIYGLLSSCLWFASQNNILSNAWMMTKTWPFFAVVFMLVSRFRSYLLDLYSDVKEQEREAALKNKLDGEEMLYAQIQKLQKNCASLNLVKTVYKETQDQLQSLENTLLLKFKNDMTRNIIHYLSGIKNAQKIFFVTLQDITVTHLVKTLQKEFQTNATLKEALLKESLNALTGHPKVKTSVVQQAIRNVLGEIQQNPNSLLRQQLNREYLLQLEIFTSQYTIRSKEAEVLKKIAHKVLKSNRTSALDLSSLAPSDLDLLNNLYQTILKRVGLEFLLLTHPVEEQLTGIDGESVKLFNRAQQATQEAFQKLHTQQLEHFLRFFV